MLNWLQPMKYDVRDDTKYLISWRINRKNFTECNKIGINRCLAKFNSEKRPVPCNSSLCAIPRDACTSERAETNTRLSIIFCTYEMFGHYVAVTREERGEPTSYSLPVNCCYSRTRYALYVLYLYTNYAIISPRFAFDASYVITS